MKNPGIPKIHSNEFETLTPDQRECWQLMCDVMGGPHHAPRHLYLCGMGIKVHVIAGAGWATFDFAYLTRLVIMAHNRCIRVELDSSGPGRIAIVMHKRHSRTGSVHSRHPTIEQSVIAINGRIEACEVVQ